MEISKEILFARRRLEEIEEMDIIDDLKWNQEAHLWFILVKIHVEKTENASIQKDTKWYIVLQESYPSGNVEIYPAVKDGVRNTFNHQNNNGVVCKNGLWRNGKLCLNNPLDIIGVGNEPDTFEEKLYWNAKRAVEWVRAAASNRLINAGEYYEIPDFIVKKGYRILYNEDMVSMMEWEDSEENWGYVDFICAGNNQYYSDTYSSISGKICKTTKWGKYVVSFKERMEGAWILLKTEPVINGWQAPNIFDELKQALRKQGIDFKSILEKIMPHFRDGKRHILMIGFPIPKKIGQEANLIHWESFIANTFLWKEDSKWI